MWVCVTIVLIVGFGLDMRFEYYEGQSLATKLIVALDYKLT